MTGSSRIPSLDGLRAVAVMIVFLSHAEIFAFMPGRLGVTIFFFLSGYIITTLMRAEYERSATVSFKRFYLRRIYRIFPPLYIVLAISGILTWFGVLKAGVSLSGALAQIFHMANYYALFASSFDFFRGTRVVWSLAVEEHFYLVFPLLFLTLVRRMNYDRLALVLALLCVAVLVWRCILFYVLGVDTRWAFLATDARIDSILYGCILAIWFNPIDEKPLVTNQLLEKIILAIALALLLFSFLYTGNAFQKTVKFTLQGIALFPIFALAIRHPDWLVFRWLSWKPVVALGAISYTFYLCHVIALLLAEKVFDNRWLVAVLGFLISIVFCTVMYRYIEAPLARKRKALNRASAEQQQTAVSPP